MMRDLKIFVLAILALGVPSAAAQAKTLTENFSKTWPLAASGSVSLKNTNGNVTFEAWDRPEVQVNAEKRVKAGSEEDARKLLSQLRIEVEAAPSAVHIETRMPKRSEGGFWNLLMGNDASVGVTYRVRVPRSAIVEAYNTNGDVQLTGTRGTGHLETTNGNIDVEGASGALALESTNGNIQVARAEGAVKAGTTNGNIEVELARVPADHDLGFSSTNGSVTVRLPPQARFSVDAATTNGSIRSDFELSGGESSRKHVTGDMNGGGGKLRIRTTNGSVEIREI